MTPSMSRKPLVEIDQVLESLPPDLAGLMQ
jgi:hypothetical protein